MYVIAGVTGQTGSAVTRSLLDQGKPVTVIVRSAEKGEAWRAKGAKVAVGALEDANKLQGILAGAEGAYLLVPPNYTATDFLEDRRRVADALAKAVSKSKIPQVVFLSSIGAQHSPGTGPIRALHYAESTLKPAARNLTVLRPPYFIENWAPLLGVAKEGGVLPSFLEPQRKIPMMATKDIGGIAAESLLNPARGRRTIELAGPEDYSLQDIARTLESLLDRQVRVQPLALPAAISTFTGLGFSENLARLFEEMFAGINSGHVQFERSRAEFRREKTSAAEVLRGLLQQQLGGDSRI